MSANLLEVSNLKVEYAHGAVKALRGVSFELSKEKLGIVGESGSGKSTVGRALMRLLPSSARVTASKLRLGSEDLLTATERSMRAIRGRKMGLILQDPKYSLNPLMSIGDQITEGYRLHFPKAPKQTAWAKMLEMLVAVQIREPERVADLLPHQISGGMGQRVMIAMMLIAEPEVLIADEPTSALDVTVRLEVLNLLNDLAIKRNFGLIFISHDLNLVKNFCDRVLIMYAGRVLETLTAAELKNAQHPYTQGLLSSMPTIKQSPKRLSTLKRDPSWLGEEAE
jgi:peptide/nickel transport system ATP-binding protein